MIRSRSCNIAQVKPNQYRQLYLLHQSRLALGVRGPRYDLLHKVSNSLLFTAPKLLGAQ